MAWDLKIALAGALLVALISAAKPAGLKHHVVSFPYHRGPCSSSSRVLRLRGGGWLRKAASFVAEKGRELSSTVSAAMSLVSPTKISREIAGPLKGVHKPPMRGGSPTRDRRGRPPGRPRIKSPQQQLEQQHAAMLGQEAEEGGGQSRSREGGQQYSRTPVQPLWTPPLDETSVESMIQSIPGKPSVYLLY
jgi:hypothetical protein